MLCKSIAKEEGRFGIRANTVAPGIIAAGLGAKLIETTLGAEIWDQQRKRVALRRFGLADDVANAVAFLRERTITLYHWCNDPRRRRTAPLISSGCVAKAFFNQISA